MTSSISCLQSGSGLDPELLALLRLIEDDAHYRQVLDTLGALMERLQSSDGSRSCCWSRSSTA